MDSSNTAEQARPEGVALRASSSALLAYQQQCEANLKRTIVVPDGIYDEMVKALADAGIVVTTIIRAGKDQLTLRRIPSYILKSE